MLACKGNFINEIGSNNKDGAKTKAKSISENNQNWIIAKFQILVKPNYDFSSKKVSRSDFLTPNNSLVFTKLRQIFVIIVIFNHFYLEFYIRIKIDISNYTLGKVYSQLELDDLGR